MNKNDDFGKILRSYRIKKNLTQQDVGNAIGRTHSFVCELEKGKRGSKRDPILIVKLSEYLEIPIGLLLDASNLNINENSEEFKKYLKITRNKVKSKRVADGFRSVKELIEGLLAAETLLTEDRRAVQKIGQIVAEIDGALTL